MKFALVTVAALLAAATAAPLTEDQYQFLFTRFSEQYGKKYEISNVFGKYETFKANVDLIVAHNASGQSYTMAINQFADLTKEEFSQFMGLQVPAGHVEIAETNSTAPCPGMKVKNEPIDWVAKGVVNEVKNQASCGSCWAFATTAPLESRMAIAGEKLLDLSEQALVDCSGSTGNNGCNGGLMSNGYNYIKNNGIPLTKDYPYTAKDEKCKSYTSVAKVSGYKTVAAGKDGHVQALQSGPIGVALAASSSAFQFYKDGVVTNCTDRSINHGVTAVAFGVENGIEYFNIRNSWGASWGNAGHIKLAADGNQCGLTTSSFDVYPTL